MDFLKGSEHDEAPFSRGLGVAIYCAGSRRYCSPNSRFLIHGIGFDARQGQRFDERLLGERPEGPKNDRITISRIISENTRRSLEEVEHACMHASNMASLSKNQIYFCSAVIVAI